MFQRTAESTIIRAASHSLLEANEGALIDLSTCNTGATWVVEGKKSRRGLDVFQRRECFADSPASIAEISFRGPVSLPDDSEFRTGDGRHWQSLIEVTHFERRAAPSRTPD